MNYIHSYEFLTLHWIFYLPALGAWITFIRSRNISHAMHDLLPGSSEIPFFFRENCVTSSTEFHYLSYNNTNSCPIPSKINVTPKGFHLPISKLHSILAVKNLLANNNVTIIIMDKFGGSQNKWSPNAFWGFIYFSVDGT